MKYPIGIQSFEQIIEDGYVYVDKTDLIFNLAHEGKIYLLSRPRRFGKSLLVSTLKNYYLGRKELFNGLKIASLEKDWNVYPVFHVDFNSTNFTEKETLEQKLNFYVTEWELKYGLSDRSGLLGIGDRFVEVLRAAHEQTGLRSVVLIDEYDKPILDVLDVDTFLEDRHRNILKAFYSVFKGADSHLQFVLLTGVTKFSQVSVFSGFNQPKDISMDARYETLCGITQKELETYFQEPVEEMAHKYKCDYNNMLARLKEQYDGYHFSDEMTDIYNPFSLLNALDSKSIEDYWFKTGTPTYLIRLMKHFNENINELTNNEVKNGFITMIATSYLQPGERITGWIFDVLDAMRAGNIEKLEPLFTSFLSSIPYSMRRKDNEREKERYFQYTFYLIMKLISVYTVYTEKQQSQGRVDCIVETPQYVYIFEFKLDGTAVEAIEQIENKGYAREYILDGRKIFKIGASFSSDTGTISDWKFEE